MSRIHPYSHQCGCNRCGNDDLQQARDDEMREAHREDLIACPAFIAELALENEEAERAAAAVKDADMAEVGRVVTKALYRAADKLIATRADESGITPGDAAQRMYVVYRSDAMTNADRARGDSIQRGNEGIDIGTWTPPGESREDEA